MLSTHPYISQQSNSRGNSRTKFYKPSNPNYGKNNFVAPGYAQGEEPNEHFEDKFEQSNPGDVFQSTSQLPYLVGGQKNQYYGAQQDQHYNNFKFYQMYQSKGQPVPQQARGAEFQHMVDAIKKI